MLWRKGEQETKPSISSQTLRGTKESPLAPLGSRGPAHRNPPAKPRPAFVPIWPTELSDPRSVWQPNSPLPCLGVPDRSTHPLCSGPHPILPFPYFSLHGCSEWGCSTFPQSCMGPIQTHQKHGARALGKEISPAQKGTQGGRGEKPLPLSWVPST